MPIDDALGDLEFDPNLVKPIQRTLFINYIYTANSLKEGELTQNDFNTGLFFIDTKKDLIDVPAEKNSDLLKVFNIYYSTDMQTLTRAAYNNLLGEAKGVHSIIRHEFLQAQVQKRLCLTHKKTFRQLNDFLEQYGYDISNKKWLVKKDETYTNTKVKKYYSDILKVVYR
jgi:hypothetical protein